jgi:hypothetical protein
MTERWATVAEARKLTGKSESTLKRLLREIVAEPNHPERGSVQPSPEEVARLRAAGQQYVWRIDRELLLRRFPLKEEEGAGAGPGAAAGKPGHAGELVVQVLQEQLQSKDEQIRSLQTQLDRKDDQIANMNERQRETNVLMRELQQRLALAPPVRTTPDTLAAEPSSETAPRPGILRRIFRR